MACPPQFASAPEFAIRQNRFQLSNGLINCPYIYGFIRLQHLKEQLDLAEKNYKINAMDCLADRTTSS